MITRDTLVARVFAVHVAIGVVIGTIVLVAATEIAAVLEFRYGEPVVSGHLRYCPQFVMVYEGVYPYAWVIVASTMLLGAWILRKPAVSLLAITVYVTWSTNTVLFWLAWTLLTFYRLNQSFTFRL